MQYYYNSQPRVYYPVLPQPVLSSENPLENWKEFVEKVFSSCTRRIPIFSGDLSCLFMWLFDPRYNCYLEYIEIAFDFIVNNTSIVQNETTMNLREIVCLWWDTCTAKELLIMENPCGGDVLPTLADICHQRCPSWPADLKAWLSLSADVF